MADSRSNLYGASELYEQINSDISGIYNQAGVPGVPLGHDPNNRNTGLAYILAPGGNPGHALTFGRTRSGKGVSTIIPALLTYAGSMVVIDPKGENAWITAERRRQLGQRVVILDPWGEVNRRYGSRVGVTEQVTNYNPLSALNPASPDFADDVSAIGDALIIQSGNDPHWSDSARELVSGVIAAEVQRNPGVASLTEVRKLIRAPFDILKTAVEMVISSDPDSVAAAKLAAFVEKAGDDKENSNREVSSIRSTARTQTAFLDSARLQESMETDNPPFELDELGTGKVTLYLVLPVDRLKSHGRWLRMILTLAIRTIARQSELPALPVLFMLDEMGTIGALSMIEQSYGLMAGLGIRIWGFLQDLPQLKRDYPQSWETFVSNSSIVQVLNCGDETTSDYVSKYLGQRTVEVNKGYSKQVRPTAAGDPTKRRGVLDAMVSGAANSMGGDVATQNKNRLEQEVWEPDLAFHGRPILFPWEVRNSSSDSSIIIMPGVYNARLRRFVYHSDPVMSKWARHDPNKPVPVIVAPPAQAAQTPAQPATASSIANDLGSAAVGWLGKKLAGNDLVF